MNHLLAVGGCSSHFHGYSGTNGLTDCGGALPYTGLVLAGFLAFAVVLLLAGWGLRRLTERPT